MTHPLLHIGRPPSRGCAVCCRFPDTLGLPVRRCHQAVLVMTTCAPAVRRLRPLWQLPRSGHGASGNGRSPSSCRCEHRRSAYWLGVSGGGPSGGPRPHYVGARRTTSMDRGVWKAVRHVRTPCPNCMSHSDGSQDSWRRSCVMPRPARTYAALRPRGLLTSCGASCRNLLVQRSRRIQRTDLTKVVHGGHQPDSPSIRHNGIFVFQPLQRRIEFAHPDTELGPQL